MWAFSFAMSSRKDTAVFAIIISVNITTVEDFAKQLKVYSRKYNSFPMRPLGWKSPKDILYDFLDYGVTYVWQIYITSVKWEQTAWIVSVICSKIAITNASCAPAFAHFSQHNWKIAVRLKPGNFCIGSARCSYTVIQLCRSFALLRRCGEQIRLSGILM